MIWRIGFVLIGLLLIASGAVPSVAAPPIDGCGYNGCTVFLVADEQQVFAGNNEDWRNPFTKMWYIPSAAEGEYGRVYVGFDNYFPQGGMNEQGLFFDGLAVDPTIVPQDEGKPIFPGVLTDEALRTCATVTCVTDLFEQYDRSFLVGGQLLFADAAGDAVIIEPDAFIRKEGPYLLSTNFYQSITPTNRITCWRYKAADQMLSDAGGTFSADLIRDVLDATHQEGSYPTLYSNVYDLKARVIYLYLFHDFEHVVKIDLAAELTQGRRSVNIRDLFPPNEEETRWAESTLSQFESTLVERGYMHDVDSSGFAAFSGRYVLPPELLAVGIGFPYIDLSVQGGTLYLSVPEYPWPPLALYPQSETRFFFTNADGDLDFSFEVMQDASGNVTGLAATVAGVDVILARMD